MKYYIFDVRNPNVPFIFKDGMSCKQEPAIYSSLEKAQYMCETMNRITDAKRYRIGEWKYVLSNEEIAMELLERFHDHYKHSPSVMKTIERVIWEVLGG